MATSSLLVLRIKNNAAIIPSKRNNTPLMTIRLGFLRSDKKNSSIEFDQDLFEAAVTPPTMPATTNFGIKAKQTRASNERKWHRFLSKGRTLMFSRDFSGCSDRRGGNSCVAVAIADAINATYGPQFGVMPG